MAAGMGVGAFETELYRCAAGQSLGPSGRYEVVRLHHSTENCWYWYAHLTWLARDVSSLGSSPDGASSAANPFVIIRILGKTATTEHRDSQTSSLADRLRQVPSAKEHLLLSLDSFHVDGKEEHLCFVYQLYGHNLAVVRESYEDVNLPAKWIWKVFKQALQSLQMLHSNGLAHGRLAPMSMIITFPTLSTADENAVRSFYSCDQAIDSMWSSNESGTGPDEADLNMDFRLKLQDMESSPAEDRLLDRQAEDLRSLAELIINFMAGVPAFYSLLDYERSLYGKTDGATHLLKKMHETRTSMRDTAPGGLPDFSLDELRIASDLLAHMLASDTDRQYTASEALRHEFFAVERPIEGPVDEVMVPEAET